MGKPVQDPNFLRDIQGMGDRVNALQRQVLKLQPPAAGPDYQTQITALDTRLTTAETNIGNLTGVTFTLGARPIPDGAVAIYDGPWSTTAPPNATTGVAFTVGTAGTYAFMASGTAFIAAGNDQACNIFVYVNGVVKGSLKLFINFPATHLSFPSLAFTTALNAGTNYIYYSVGASVTTSNTGDHGSFVCTRIA